MNQEIYLLDDMSEPKDDFGSNQNNDTTIISGIAIKKMVYDLVIDFL